MKREREGSREREPTPPRQREPTPPLVQRVRGHGEIVADGRPLHGLSGPKASRHAAQAGERERHQERIWRFVLKLAPAHRVFLDYRQIFKTPFDIYTHDDDLLTDAAEGEDTGEVEYSEEDREVRLRIYIQVAYQMYLLK